MYADKKKTQQNQTVAIQEYHINLNEYAGDEDDYKIATEQANSYCEDCERAVGPDKTTIKRDTIESE